MIVRKLNEFTYYPLNLAFFPESLHLFQALVTHENKTLVDLCPVPRPERFFFPKRMCNAPFEIQTTILFFHLSAVI